MRTLIAVVVMVLMASVCHGAVKTREITTTETESYTVCDQCGKEVPNGVLNWATGNLFITVQKTKRVARMAP